MTTQDTINRIQEIEYDILQKIDSICRAHNITYFAIGGSVLGAVRHQGFIPWDDDIDIGMTRRDYDTFLKYAIDELPNGYFLQTFTTEKKSPFYFTKVRKDNTKFVEYYLRDLNIHQGFFVDIFPFDNVPDNKIIRNIHYLICRFANQLFLSKSLTTICSSRIDKKDGYKIYIRRILHTLLLPVPKSLLFNILDKCVQLFNHSDCKEISHIVRKRLRIKIDDLYPIIKMPFGKTEMPVPNNYDAYLSAQYGDYKNLPEKAKRHGHLPYCVEFESQEELV